MMARLWLALLTLLLAAPLPVLAHPHVLIDVHAVAEMENGKVVSLLMGWKFDPIYSGTVAADFDANKNGQLERSEIATMERDAFRDTAKQSYFTFIAIDGMPVKGLTASDFDAKVFQDKALIYSFRLRLPAPVDPRTQRLSITSYEESYYIDMDFAPGKPVAVTGPGADGCEVLFSDDLAHIYFGGAITPRKAEILCAP